MSFFKRLKDNVAVNRIEDEAFYELVLYEAENGPRREKGTLPFKLNLPLKTKPTRPGRFIKSHSKNREPNWFSE
jgi:hypothetical protein